ncbi:Ornithine carbamoyltransferase chain F [Variovorax sp. PBL-H6]|uniref:hypothetical protein n=1 Tax=Variovorax sp. PBL-H6 TaxID=434009 RepID=UPI001316B1FE|nr:hypothetical protein [Variovorax sp. PBL-H6]VTU27694.1 Ornithine carbamoyltransferase chain F [Variovorax sp. PBL-H6]
MTGIKPGAAASPTFAFVKSALFDPHVQAPLREPLLAKSIFETFVAVDRLRAGARAGALGHPLRGKNLALLLGPDSGAEVPVLRRAAQDLGARVAELRFTAPADPGAPARDDVRVLARMLGRMYDAVDCGHLPPAAARQVEQDAAVPVYRGLALDDHPARVVADLMTLREQRSPPGASILFLGDPSTVRGRRFVAAAREAEFDVRIAGRGQSTRDDATFLVDATHSPHWSLLASACPVDEARRAENHRSVIQAVLLDTIVKG